MVGFPKGQDTNRIVRGTRIASRLPSFTSPPAGLTYCAIGALAFVNNYPAESPHELLVAQSSGISCNDCARWMIDRQTTYLEEDETESEEQSPHLSETETVPLPSSPLGSPHATQFPANAHALPRLSSSRRSQTAKAQTLQFSEEDLAWAGFNGRLNKIADTCYCFWNTGALSVSLTTTIYLALG
jgi:geranylgeranyl transferase type-1 subunit beta